MLSKFTKSKESSSFGSAAGLLNLAQKQRGIPEANLLQLTEGESEAEAALDDAIAVAEVETGEPAATEMVATKDVSTITDETQVAPIEIDTSGAPS